MVVEGFNILFSSIGVMMAVSLIAVAYQFPLEEMPGLRQLLGLICGGVVRAPSPLRIFFAFAGFTAAPALSPLPLRFLCRLTCCGGGQGLVSMPAAWAMRDARQPSDAAHISFFASIREVRGNLAFRWLMAADVIEGLKSNVHASFFLYYYTFVARLTDAQIAVWIAAVPIIGLLLKSALAGFWGRLFSAKTVTPRLYTVYGQVADACT